MSKYDSSDIKILEGLEAVRKRPGMYIGSTDERGLHHLVWEIVDNAIDEVLNGHGDQINITINKDNSITVEDFGRGIPTSKHESGMDTPVVIFTKLHAGGKFGGNGYKTSGGLHGVGSSVVNALSDFVKVEICRDGSKYAIEFTEGGEKYSELSVIGKSRKTGTKVTFKPSASIFSTTNYNFKTIKKRIQESAFLISGLKLTVTDARIGESVEYHYEDGIKAFLKYLTTAKKTITKAQVFKDENEIEIEVGVQYTDNYNEEIISFVNNVRTGDGGTHEVGFKTALTKAINEYARKSNLLKTKDKNFEGVDVREGLVAIISIKIPENLLQFEGQTKSKLGTPEARGAVDSMLSTALVKYFELHPNEANKVISKVVRARAAREAAKKARLDARKETKNKKEVVLSGKLTPAHSKDPKEKELYLVEGDSAGGSAKQGRNRRFQAILPLRGKVVNTEKARMEDILKNEELSTIIHTIGASVGSDFDIENINYDKIIIMTDADTDGAHIQILLLTFFFRFMKPLFEQGKIYIAQPPLFKVSTYDNKQVEYAWDEEGLSKVTANFSKKYYIQRYKGLGEMDANQLWDTTMNPETRQFLKVGIDDIVNAENEISILMGENVPLRRQWIESNIDFSVKDEFDLEAVNGLK